MTSLNNQLALSESNSDVKLSSSPCSPSRDSSFAGDVGRVTRRSFIATGAGLAGAALLSGCGTSSSATPSTDGTKDSLPISPKTGAISASDAPEVTDLKFGIIALTDCSPIVIAHEKGLFKKYGINSTVSKGASWAAIRDAPRKTKFVSRVIFNGRIGKLFGSA